MYYKKFSQKDIEILRGAIANFKKNCQVIEGKDLIQKGDFTYDDFKRAEKIEKKLVHCYYLDRGNKWNYLLITM